MIVTINDLLREIDRMRHALDLDQRRLGSDLADIAVDGILDNMQAGVDPDGNAWAPLNPDYFAWKQTVAPGRETGYLYGLMTELGQLRGIQTVYPDWMTQQYGVTHQADEEARDFSEGGARTGTGQPPRLFFAFTAQAVARMNTLCDGRFITETGG